MKLHDGHFSEMEKPELKGAIGYKEMGDFGFQDRIQ